MKQLYKKLPLEALLVVFDEGSKLDSI